MHAQCDSKSYFGTTPKLMGRLNYFTGFGSDSTNKTFYAPLRMATYIKHIPWIARRLLVFMMSHSTVPSVNHNIAKRERKRMCKQNY